MTLEDNVASRSRTPVLMTLFLPVRDCSSELTPISLFSTPSISLEMSDVVASLNDPLLCFDLFFIVSKCYVCRESIHVYGFIYLCSVLISFVVYQHLLDLWKSFRNQRMESGFQQQYFRLVYTQRKTSEVVLNIYYQLITAYFPNLCLGSVFCVDEWRLCAGLPLSAYDLENPTNGVDRLHNGRIVDDIPSLSSGNRNYQSAY